MCGIFGYSGKTPVDLAKMKVLGIYNQSRGKHSCGYYTDGELRHGIDKASEWMDFIKDGMLIKGENRKGGLVFIGHTRMATTGAHTIANAHPFKVDNYVQAHNGTLDNPWDLCEKYGIDHSQIHVDSLALAHLIKQEGWKILDEYVGYAALLIHFTDEPDAIFAYHGAAFVKKDDKNLTEERPLYYMDTKSGVYFSSLPEALMAIRDTIQQEPKILEHNKVYKFKKGVLEGVVYNVLRENNNLELERKKLPCSYPTTAKAKQTFMFSTADPAPKTSMVLKESEPPEANDSKKVYMRFTRYWCTVDKKPKLLEGIYNIARGGDIIQPGEKSEYTVEQFYFIRGAMMQGKKAYEKALKQMESSDTVYSEIKKGDYKGNVAFYLSKYSRYPLTCLADEGLNIVDDLRFKWYRECKPYDGTMDAKFTERRYVVKRGYLDTVTRPNSAPLVFPKVDKDEVNVVKKIPAQVIPLVDTERAILNARVAGVKEWFMMKYLHINETENLPEAVYKAIEIYVDDLNNLEQITVPNDVVEQQYMDFLNNSVKQKITFQEAMDERLRQNIEYYIEAAIIEVDTEIAKDRKKKEELDAKKTAILKTLPDIDDTTSDGVLTYDEGYDAPIDAAFDKEFDSETALKQFDKIIDVLNKAYIIREDLKVYPRSKFANDLQDSLDLAIDSCIEDLAYSVKNQKDIDRDQLKAKLNLIKTPF